MEQTDPGITTISSSTTATNTKEQGQPQQLSSQEAASTKLPPPSSANDANGTTAAAAPPSANEALAPASRFGGSGSVSSSIRSSTPVNVQPRLEEPHLFHDNSHHHRQESNQQHQPNQLLQPPYLSRQTSRGAVESSVATPKREKEAAATGGAAAAASAATSPAAASFRSKGDGKKNNSDLPPATLRLSFPDFDTTGSNHCFLSEPSMSADDDESRVRAPHRLMRTTSGGGVPAGRLFRRANSPPTNHHHRMAQYSPVPSSPGNTSLSSWESPGRSKNHRVLLQFTPSAFRSGAASFSQVSSVADSQPQVPQTEGQPKPPTAAGAATNRLGSPKVSARTGSPPHHDRGDKQSTPTSPLETSFDANREPPGPLPALNETRPILSSEIGDAPTPSFESSTNSFRRLIGGIVRDGESASDSLVFDSPSRTGAAAASINSPGISPQSQTTGTSSKIKMNGLANHNGDESIVMDLSESDEEIVNSLQVPIRSSNGGDGDDHLRQSIPEPTRVFTFDSDYMLDHAADDEKTATHSETAIPTTPATSVDVKKPAQAKQVRARSGDTAAATLATGGRDWKGMKMNNIPHPDEVDDEDEYSRGRDVVSSKQQQGRHENYLSKPQQQSHKKLPSNSISNAKSNLDSNFARESSSTSSSDEDGRKKNNKDKEIKITRRRQGQRQDQLIPQHQRRSNLKRPPKPGTRAGNPTPLLTVPPPPQIVPPPPVINSPGAGQYANYNSPIYGYSNNISSHLSSSPYLSPHNLWATAPQPQGMLFQDGQQKYGYSSMQELPPPSMWDGQQRPMGESVFGRERFYSLDPPPDATRGTPTATDATIIVAEDRRNLWRTQPQSYSSRSLQGTSRWDRYQNSTEDMVYGRRQRLGSWDPASYAYPDTNAPAVGEDRRAAWVSGHRNASARSLQSAVVDEDSYHGDGGSQRSLFSAGSVDGGSHLNSICEDEEDSEESGGPFRDPQTSAQQIEMETPLNDSPLRGSTQKAMLSQSMAPLGSPFSNMGKTQEGKFNRASFFPTTYLAEEDKLKYPTFICPRCKTRQRAFFGVSNAPKQLEGPTSYLALYFILYVTASLFIFGLEEGWNPLDCIYFAVISLTTAGLGDFVPTTDSNKIICSIFVYFGIACIGLLLGSYIASMLDDKADTDAKRKQADSCLNCARIQNLKDAAQKRFNKFPSPASARGFFHKSYRHLQTERTANYTPRNIQKPQTDHNNEQPKPPESISNQISWAENSFSELGGESSPPPPPPPMVPPSQSSAIPIHPFGSSSSQYSVHSPQITGKSPVQANILGSPMTRQILGRQSHTRHASFDIGLKNIFAMEPSGNSGSSRGTEQRKYMKRATPLRSPRIREDEPEIQAPANNSVRSRKEIHTNQERAPNTNETTYLADSSDENEESSENGSSSVATVDQIVDDRLYKIKAAKYVLLTLQGALGNSFLILVVGCIGFYLIENMTFVDSWYFTTVLLTTTGYGDIVPVTRGGKLFATVYLLVGGTVLLHNMSKISMIPLELRKRRIERAVLTQFGDSLDDDALRELATGPLIKRLSLTADRSDGLAECTREMFALAMLVRLGKVSEDDIKQTFAAFRRLDHNNEGVLNSKSIIAGMIHRRRILNPTSSNLQREMQSAEQEELRRIREQQEQADLPQMGSFPPPTEQPTQGFLFRQDQVDNSHGQGHIHFAPLSEPPAVSVETSALLHHNTPPSYESGSPYHYRHNQYPYQAPSMLNSPHLMNPYQTTYF